jgi:hypothetical protein
MFFNITKRSTQKAKSGAKSKTPVDTKGISMPKSPFKFLIMTEKEKKGLEMILKKAKIKNASFLASYEEKIFG